LLTTRGINGELSVFASKLEEFALSFTPGFSPVTSGGNRWVNRFNGLVFHRPLSRPEKVK